jgi:hypothetical protein
MKVLLDWNRKDKILLGAAVAVTSIFVVVIAIILLDPYYGPCQYYYVSSGKCQDNRAWHIQEGMSVQIHNIINKIFFRMG